VVTMLGAGPHTILHGLMNVICSVRLDHKVFCVARIYIELPQITVHTQLPLHDSCVGEGSVRLSLVIRRVCVALVVSSSPGILSPG